MLHVFAGAGIVPGSDAQAEWDETQMKMQNILKLITQPRQPLVEMPNINTLWATLLVEELARNGVDHFCVCPGSRSTPLAVSDARLVSDFVQVFVSMSVSFSAVHSSTSLCMHSLIHIIVYAQDRM